MFAMITLYDYELSGNCYKVRLLLSFLDIAYKTVPVDFYPGREHKSPRFLRLNPLGTLPVIEDDGFVLRDSQAILIYLAAKYDKSGSWYPSRDPQLLGDTVQWLAFADALTTTIGAARLHDAMFYELDVVAARRAAYRYLDVMEAHLWYGEQQDRQWLAGPAGPTLADVACFPYTILSEEGGVFRQDYPAIRRWTDRFKRIPNFVVMAGVFPAGPIGPY
jgi:glutathione S-transferase